MANKFPQIMGIVNVTPDSFSDGGEYFKPSLAINHALNLIDDGAEIVDIGGESTRPGALPITPAEEINRILPVISEIKKLRPSAVISIDTVHTETASIAVEAGAEIINDISGLNTDPDKCLVAAKYNVALILMHMQGNPGNMQINPVYENVTTEVIDFLAKKIQFAKDNGVKKIYADPGIGFGKNLDHNLALLRNLKDFKSLNVPLVLGVSRKSFIGKLLKIDNPADRDVQTAFLHALLLKEDIDIIRVHNVKHIKQISILYNNL